jgi:hypothetical protein
LPWVLRKLGLDKLGRAETRHRNRHEVSARIETARAALARLETIAKEQKLPDEIVAPWRERELQRIAQFETERNPKGDGFTLTAGVHRAELALIEAERARLNELLREGKVTDEIRRRIERGLDLDEERLRRNVRGISSDGDDDDGRNG